MIGAVLCGLVGAVSVVNGIKKEIIKEKYSNLYIPVEIVNRAKNCDNKICFEDLENSNYKRFNNSKIESEESVTTRRVDESYVKEQLKSGYISYKK